MKRTAFVMLVALCSSSCFGSSANVTLTPTQTIQSVATQVEQSADAMLIAAQQLAVSNPAVMTQDRRIAVDIAGDRIGRLGADLGTAIDGYNAIKANKGDLTSQATLINQILSAITQALSDLGKQVPPGIMAMIDQAVTTILGLIAQVKASL